MPLAPPLLRRVLVTVDIPAVTVKEKVAPTTSTRVITSRVHRNSGAIAAKNLGDLAAALQDEVKDTAVAVGTNVVKPLAVALTRAARSAPRQEAAHAVTEAAATQTVTATTAQKVADEGTPSVRRTPSMSEEAVEDVGGPEDVSTPHPPQRTPAHDHVATAGRRGIGGTTAAAHEVPVAGATALVDRGGVATVEAEAQAAAPPVRTKAPLTDETPGAKQTATLIAETSTAHASTAPSLHVHHYEALTAAPILPPLRL